MTVPASMRGISAASGSLIARYGGQKVAGASGRLNPAKLPSSTRGLRTRRQIARPTISPITPISESSKSQTSNVAHPELVSWDEIASKVEASATQDVPRVPSPKPSSPKPTATKQKTSAPNVPQQTSAKPTSKPTSTPTSKSEPATKGSQPKSRDYIQLSPSSLSQHWDTLPPSEPQLEYAEKYFQKKPCRPFKWSAPKFHSMARSESPEVCFLGRSNVGKSSLLNALLGGGYANVSSKPGRTKMMNAFEIGNSTDPTRNLVVLDMPGYGKGGQADWGKEILKYLGQRKQLKRAFVLVDAEVGLKKTDEQLLAIFRKENIPHQIVLSKVDKLLFTKNRMPSEGALNSRLEVLRQVFDHVRRISQPNPEDVSGALGEVIACSSNRLFGQRLGINELRHSMLQAADLQMSGERKLIPETEVVPHEVVFGSSEAW